MRNVFKLWTLLLAVAILTTPALGHPGHAGHGFADGLAHPLLGTDHVLAMLAVGLWAAQLGARAFWCVPLAFVVCTLLGSALALGGIQLPMVESGILASVVVLGLLVAVAARVPTLVAALGVGLFAILHGHAHAAGLTAGTAPVAYLVAFALATAFLQGIGLALGTCLSRWASQQWVRYAGGAISMAGIGLIAAL